MKITKFVHSCLLIEEAGKKIIIDPGNYTAESNLLNIEKIDNLDYLLITHEHQDHMYMPLVKQIVNNFPEIKIISNESVKDILGKESIEVFVDSDDFISIELVSHEKIFGIRPPLNMMFNIGDTFSDPGDSLSFKSTKRVLALPVQAPWGSLTQAVELAVSLKPEVIIPIHDWHWNDAAREAFYSRLEDYFKIEGINFIGLKTGILQVI